MAFPLRRNLNFGNKANKHSLEVLYFCYYLRFFVCSLGVAAQRLTQLGAALIKK
jgi:hypothetical protein